MKNETKHISICICTYKRPELLKRLLKELSEQDTEGRFTYSIVVAENDDSQLAEPVVSDFAARSAIPIKYCIEPRRNIALTRNKAIENADGDFIVFIDDDEFPNNKWLLSLFNACGKYQADGVLGPVMPYFDKEAPRWVVKGGFYDRPTHPTGMVLDWAQTRTGNVLLKSELVTGEAQPFRAEILGGSDQDFFKRMMKKGHAFIWCNEAVVYEVVPPVRWKRRYLVRRALFHGVFSEGSLRPSARAIAISLIAVPAYSAALPVALVLGQARFMNYVFRLSYHLGRLLALLGINPIKEAYVTE